jgi:hypothetical protein
MLFREDAEGWIAVSQPAHAWISGQLLRALPGDLGEPLYLAAEQHDIAWLDWEVEPSFDAAAGRPHLFRDVGVHLHAPMWLRGVERALAAYGPHVALLLSRHGGVIYRRFWMRHQHEERDKVAAQAYLEKQAPREAQWAAELGLSRETLEFQSDMIAFVDMLSLALCGELKPPLEIPLPVLGGAARTFVLQAKPGAAYDFTMSPWPFAKPKIEVEAEGRRLSGRFESEAAFRDAFAAAPRVTISARLSGG